MISIAFDTFAAANRFKRAGFTEDQIEALVEVTRETTALPDISTLATKADIQRLELATRADIERLERATKSDFERLEQATKSDISLLKSDIEQLRLATRSDIERLEQATRADIARLEAKISAAQFQSVAVIIAAMALIVTLGATLPRLLG